MSDTNNEELRAAIIDLDAGRHICGDEGAGCTIEEFKGNWPGAVGTYYRCKQLREHYDQVMAAITSRDQQIALAARMDELNKVNSHLISIKVAVPALPPRVSPIGEYVLNRIATLKAQEKP